MLPIMVTRQRSTTHCTLGHGWRSVRRPPDNRPTDGRAAGDNTLMASSRQPPIAAKYWTWSPIINQLRLSSSTPCPIGLSPCDTATWYGPMSRVGSGLRQRARCADQGESPRGRRVSSSAFSTLCETVRLADPRVFRCKRRSNVKLNVAALGPSRRVWHLHTIHRLCADFSEPGAQS